MNNDEVFRDLRKRGHPVIFITRDSKKTPHKKCPFDAEIIIQIGEGNTFQIVKNVLGSVKGEFEIESFVPISFPDDPIDRTWSQILYDAIKEHHAQKADDRCIEDDDRLYRAAGLPPCDRRVGNKEEMLKNCARFIDRRCQQGHWPTYKELEDKVAQLTAELKQARGEV